MIADSNTMRRLDAFRIQMDFAAVDGRRRKTSRLEEPGMPQPFVQTMIVGVLLGCHKRTDLKDTREGSIRNSYNSAMHGTEFLERLRHDTEALDAAGLLKRERVIGSAQGPVIRLSSGQEMINLCANNYLGLANHPAVLKAAHEGLTRYGYGVASVLFFLMIRRPQRYTLFPSTAA